MSPDVVVVGGGVSGLACAFTLRRRGFDVVVLERDSVAGGNVRTSMVDGFRVERGPHTFMASADDVFDLAEAVGVGDELVTTLPSASARFIVRGGRLHAVPTGPLSFLGTRLLSWRGKLALAVEPWRSALQHPDDTAATFFDRRFGREAARVMAGAFINGVYAGDPSVLSARAAFPLFWDFERDAGSMIRGAIRHRRRRAAARVASGRPRRRGLYSLRGGLGRLTEALAAKLGDRCLTSREVEALARHNGSWAVRAAGAELIARQVVIAAPPRQAAALLAPVDGAMAKLVAATPMSPVAVTHLGFPRRVSTVPDGFGFLAPRGEGVRSLGILFASRLFGDRAPAGGDLLTSFAGGVLDVDALGLGDDALIALALADLERLLGVAARPALAEVTRYPEAIPQLVVGHAERIEALEARLGALPGLHLAGNWLRGIGLKDAVASGLKAAARVLAAPRARVAS
jgi:oxygen-dependent protoporphyrinogen oxidase